jgi:glucose-6-phosphate isomerase
MSPAGPPNSLQVLEAQTAALMECPAWAVLREHAGRLSGVPLRDLLAEHGRFAAFSRRAGPLLLDFSRQRLTHEALTALLDLASQRRLVDWREQLFAGAAVNNTERRPALHMALRNLSDKPIYAGSEDVMPAVRGERDRMLRLADAIASGEYTGHTGCPIEDVVNIGIGGSDLGLVMGLEALRPHCKTRVRTHCVSNIDGTQLADVLATASPECTVFIVCSKSFTTQETQLNADAARRWLLERLPAEAVGRHFLAISVNDAAMDRFGIARNHRFRIWDWIGGRYSMWSTVGMILAIALGSARFLELLRGASELDAHFREAPAEENLPVLMALMDVWNQNFLGTHSRAVLPYSARLARLPSFLQQLEMESLGKSVVRDGSAVAWDTGTVVWGEAGSNAQHAFFQLLHQGTASFAADFIAPAAGERSTDVQHLAGLANMLAQAEAFARGRTRDEVERELGSAGRRSEDIARLAAHKVHAGNHPSTIVLLERLDPRSLGWLIALYEHKVFVLSVIWGINCFDQWGVELGKVLAGQMGDVLAAGAATGETSAVNQLARAIRGLRGT